MQANPTDSSGQPQTPIAGVAGGSMLDYALRYAAVGLPVLPLYAMRKGVCSCGSTTCKSPGKHPYAPLVPKGHTQATTDTAILAEWFKDADERGLNIGVRPPPHVVAIDIDPRNGGHDVIEHLQAQHGALPDTITAYTGGGGRHLLYHCDPTTRFGGKLGKGVDIKTNGGFLVVEPSNHASGKNYSWDAEADPLSGGAFAVVPTWIAAVSSAKTQADVAISITKIEPRIYHEIRSALASIDPSDYDTWIEIGQCLQSTGAGFQAFGLWDEWSQGCPEKYKESRRTLMTKWDSFRGSGVTLNTLFMRALDAGWIKPDDELAKQVRENGRPVKQKAQAIVEAPTPQIPCNELAALTNWLETHYGIPTVLATATALAVAGALAGRRYSESTNIYILMGGNQSVLANVERAVLNLFAGAQRLNMLRASRMSTTAALYQHIYRHPASLYFSHDIAYQFAMARRQTTGGLDAVMIELGALLRREIVVLASGADMGDTDKQMNRRHELIHPSLGVLATVDIEQSSEMFVRKSGGKALIGSMLWIECEDAPNVLDARVAAPDWWFMRVNDVCRHDVNAGNLADTTDNNCTLHPRIATPGVTLPDLSVMGHLLSGLTGTNKLMARRIAATIAIWSNPHAPTITQQLLEWAVAYVNLQTPKFLARAHIASTEDGRRDVRDFVLERLAQARHEGLSNRSLQHECKPFRNLSSKARAELMNDMAEDGSIVILEGKRLGLTYLDARFATPVTPMLTNVDPMLTSQVNTNSAMESTA